MEPIRTIHRHIQEQERRHPDASGTFTALLEHIALAAKVIGHHVNKAGLLDVLGAAGFTNIQQEQVQKLDVVANGLMKEVLLHSGTVAGIVSEEEERIVQAPAEGRGGPYVVLFDPLDGSSNIDANVTIGTIFSIHRKISAGDDVQPEDVFQRGRDLLGAGYVVYGSSTMLVYSAGAGVQGFTYDPSYGEFLLSHPDILMPDRCSVYSVNEVNWDTWPEAARRLVRRIKSRSEPRYRHTTGRYIGSLVADFHRNLLYGGIFLYPETTDTPNGKLRLLYEGVPLSYISEQAGGAATNGFQRILDIQPAKLHQRVPLIIGNTREVEMYEALRREEGSGG